MNKKKLSIVILSTDTPHHRYFINFFKKIKGMYVKKIFFEKKKNNNSYQFKFFFFNSLPNIFKGIFFNPYLQVRITDKILQYFEFNKFSKKIKLHLEEKSFEYVDNVNSERVCSFLRSNSIDLIIVYGTGKVLRKVYALPKYQSINAHGGLLPQYRGLDTNLWAIYNNDYNSLYSTIHKVEEKFDTGEILAQKKLDIMKLNFFNIRYQVTLDICRIIERAITNLLKKKYIYKKQNKSNYYKPMPLLLKIITFLKLKLIKL